MDVPSGLTLGHLSPQTRLCSYVGRVNPLSLQLSYEPVSLQQILSPFCLEPRPHVSTMRPVSRLLLPYASEAPTWPWPRRSCLRPLDQQARAECRRLILTPAMIDPLVVDLPCSRTRPSHGPRDEYFPSAEACRTCKGSLAARAHALAERRTVHHDHNKEVNDTVCCVVAGAAEKKADADRGTGVLCAAARENCERPSPGIGSQPETRTAVVPSASDKA